MWDTISLLTFSALSLSLSQLLVDSWFSNLLHPFFLRKDFIYFIYLFIVNGKTLLLLKYFSFFLCFVFFFFCVFLKLRNQETSISGSQISEDGTSEIDFTKGAQSTFQNVPTVSMSQAQRFISLFFALCTKVCVKTAS